MSKARVSQTTVPSNRKKVIPNPQRNKSSSSLAPRGEPWNHKQFLKRVQTFNSLKWHIKRNDVHPLFCARFGWKCIGQNTLQCTECGTKINYKSNPLWNMDTNNKVAAAFLHNISFAHNPHCIWKKNPCHQSFEYLPTDRCVMKQQLIENMTSWIQTDTHSFYLMSKLEPIAKTLMEKSIGNTTLNPWCEDILFMSVCGWTLTGSMNGNDSKYIECQYCNKCISFQSYDYHKVLSLFPEEEDERKKHDHDWNVSNILNQQLPIHDTESVIHRLSALGLKIDCNVRRTHSFQIYETKILQKPAHFKNDGNEEIKCNSLGSSMVSTPSFASFRQTVHRPFGCNNMVWPKQSILTQSNSISASQSQSTQCSARKVRKKRTRNEMSADGDEIDAEQCPRKKLKTYRAHVNMENTNTNTNNKESSKKKRKNRKRKTMESEDEESVCADLNAPNVKKRKVNPMEIGKRKVKKNRKRRFKDVFETEEMKDSDEDDDIESEMETNMKYSQPSSKRARVQKPYFDPIHLHNDHCPFKRKYKYRAHEDEVCGWRYGLRLLVKDNVDIGCIIKQMIADQSKNERNKI